MKKIDIIDNLCREWCPYYKQGKNEELACEGFRIIERLIREGKRLPFEKPAQMSGPHRKKELMSLLCAGCPFHGEDCDFIQLKEGAPPCGGFTLVAHLLAAGVITIDNITDIR